MELSHSLIVNISKPSLLLNLFHLPQTLSTLLLLEYVIKIHRNNVIRRRPSRAAPPRANHGHELGNLATPRREDSLPIATRSKRRHLDVLGESRWWKAHHKSHVPRQSLDEQHSAVDRGAFPADGSGDGESSR